LHPPPSFSWVLFSLTLPSAPSPLTVSRLMEAGCQSPPPAPHLPHLGLSFSGMCHHHEHHGVSGKSHRGWGQTLPFTLVWPWPIFVSQNLHFLICNTSSVKSTLVSSE
jgi:hypothetical protein